MTVRSPLGLLACVLVTSTFVSATARAQSKATCATAAEDAQSLRQQGKLQAAREKLIVCANEHCPDLVRGDCQRWMAEVDAALPTVVFRAVDARGNDIIGVRVSLDGHAIAASLDGKAVALDPGPHHLRFEAAGAEPIDMDVLVTQGQRDRAITATFPVKLSSSGVRDEAAPSKVELAPAPHETPQPLPPPQVESPAPRATARSMGPYVVGGVGVLALGAFAVLDLTAWSDVRSLRDGCGRTQSCAQSEVDAVSTRITLSKVALGIGLVGVAAGVTWWVLDTRDAAPSAARLRVRALPITGGAALDAAAVF